MQQRSRYVCAAWFAAASVSIGASQAAQPSTTVTVAGCVQREQSTAALGVKSPSGFVLMNVSNSPFGGALPNDPERPAATAGGQQPQAGSDAQPRSGDPQPGRAGGSAISPGLTYLLDGRNIDRHAGERVEVRGTLQPTTTKLPLVKNSARGGAPANLPQRLVVQSLRTLSKDCLR
jgi:hypothetical protein